MAGADWPSLQAPSSDRIGHGPLFDGGAGGE